MDSKVTHRNFFLFVIGMMVVLSAPPAVWAQAREPAQIPDQTKPLYIAMIFHKLSGMTPDLGSWIKSTKEYRNADIFKKEDILKERTRELAKTFNLISPYEAITLNTTVSLSPYDPATPGLLINSFNNEIIFPIDYMNENFDIVPERLAKFRRIEVSEDAAAYIRQRTENGTKARVEFQLTPVPGFGEEEPREFKGIMYWPPMQTKIESIRVWSADKKEMLWKNKPDDTGNKVKPLFYQGAE